MSNQNERDQKLIEGDEVNVRELIMLFWNRKLLITSFTSIAAILSVLYALYLPNIYTSSALLAPAESSSSSLSGGLSQMAGMASLAGISLPGSGMTGNKSVEAIERIQSFEFFEKYFLPTISMQNLLAVDSWDSQQNIISYVEEDFDAASNKWIRSATYPKSSIPSAQEAFEKFSQSLSIDEDKMTGFISISIEHQSPYIAQKWVNNIIQQINESMRESDKNKAEKSISFLNSQIANVNYEEVRQALSQLIQNQIKNLMLIESDNYYVLKVLDSPIAPEKRSAPVRSVIAILGTIFGFISIVVFTIISHYITVHSILKD